MNNPKRNPASSPWMTRLLLLGAFLSATLYLAIAPNATPEGDDWSMWRSVDELGSPWAVAHYRYFHWTGRWAQLLLRGAVAQYINFIELYTVLLVTIMLTSWLGWVGLVRGIWGKQISWKLAASLGLLVYVLNLANTPDPPETLFWWTSAVVYPLGSALAMILTAGVFGWARTVSGLTAVRMTAVPLLGLALFAVVSFNEMLAIQVMLVLAAASAVAWLNKLPGRLLFSVMFAAALGGTVVTVLAPGNDVRSEGLPRTFALSDSIRVTFQQVMNVLPAWIMDARLLCASLLMVLWPREELSRPSWLKAIRPVAIYWFVLIWMTGLLAGFLIPSLALGEVMKGRTLSTTHIWFHAGWFFLLSLTLKEREDEPGFLASSQPLRAALTGILVVGLLLTGNPRAALSDLASGRASLQGTMLHKRLSLLREARLEGKTEVTVPYIYPSATMLKYLYLSPNPEYWNNQLYADYFHLEAVRVAPPPNED